MARLLVVISFSFLCCLNTILAQPLLKLNDAIAIALENNYSILIAKNEAELAKLNNTTGAAGMLPNINATLNQDNQTINTQQRFLNGTENIRNGAANNSLNGNVDLGWTVFNGTKMFITSKKLAQLELQSNLKLKQQVEQTVVKITKAYFDIVLAKNQLQFASNAVALSKARYTFANDKFLVGRFAKTEMLNAKVDLNADEALLLRAKNNLTNAKFNLNQLIVKPINTEFDVEENIEFNKLVDLSSILPAIENNYTGLKLIKSNKEINRYALKEFKADRWPTLQLRTGYLYSSINSQAGFLQSATNNGFHIGGGIGFNIFNGFDLNRKISAATLQNKSIDLVYKDSISKVEVAVMQLINAYNSGLEMVNLEKENVNTAQENYSITEEQYKVGVITSVQLRIAQQALISAQNRLLNAKYETKLIEADLLRFSGKLLE